MANVTAVRPFASHKLATLVAHIGVPNRGLATSATRLLARSRDGHREHHGGSMRARRNRTAKADSGAERTEALA